MDGSRILVVDDVPANLDVLIESLEAANYVVLVATSGGNALAVAEREGPDLILLDVAMPEMDGLETCRRLQERPATRGIPVIFLTALGDMEQIAAAFEAGAVDYVVKPFRREEVMVRICSHLERAFLARELAERNSELSQKALELQESYRRAEEINKQLKAEISRSRSLDSRLSMISRREAERWGIEGFVGHSPTMKKILREIGLLQNANTTSVLIMGESGTGKELIARAIHSGSDRADRPFVAVNCASIPNELAESLLFGHLAGAFTGAQRDQAGYFEMADGGTLFLDEIGTMPASVQPKLLRVLEDGCIRRLGAKAEQRVDVRVLAATNSPSASLREDLYFRLARFTVEVPPLRERTEDIPLLARHFLRMFAAEMGAEPPEFTAEGLESLFACDFPGNVRELKNMVERALIESGGGNIGPRHLRTLRMPPQAASAVPRTPALESFPLNLAEAEALLIRRAVEQAGGNVTQAARLLGIDRNKIYRKLAQGKNISPL
jgi:DNA-binding NtrC family response regulator